MQELVATIHQILVTMTGSAGALALAAIVGKCLPRILKSKAKAVRGHRLDTGRGGSARCRHDHDQERGSRVESAQR